MGKNTAKAQRELADEADERKNKAARRGDMLDAMGEQIVANDYRERAKRSERDRRSW